MSLLLNANVKSLRPIFFPVLEKEDWFAEDSDLGTDSDLIKRRKDAIDKVISMEANIDGHNIEYVENFRFLSKVSDLIFTQDNVYDVKPGPTRSVCDGYWAFLNSLPIGR